MDAAVKEKWLAALRSGEYAQTTGVLYSPGGSGDTPAGYCCLGVLADLYIKETGEDSWDLPEEGSVRPASLASCGLQAMPSRDIKAWAGMETMNIPQPIPCTVKGSTGPAKTFEARTLIDLNDSAGYTFDQIADVIEAQL